jgi:hypothetical protein
VAPINGPYAGLYFSGIIGSRAAGSHSYTIRTTDSTGVSSESSGSFNVTAATITPPSITSVVVGETTPKNGILESNESLVITWIATSSNGIASQTLTVDGSTVTPINGPYAGIYFSAVIGTRSAGSHSYAIHTTDSMGVSSDSSGGFSVAAALTVEAAAAPQGSAAVLSDAQLAPIAAEAIQRLEKQLGSQVETAMAGVNIKVANLASGVLGETLGNTIWIDDDAAGYGWFIDPTPRDDAEFSLVSASDLVARVGNAANSRADLLTTVMHEMGHVLGYEHSDSADLMNPTLPLGERRLLAGADAATALAISSQWNHRSSEKGALDEVFASFNQDDKRDWSWL